MFKLKYVQPRPASYNSCVPIFEKKEYRFEAAGEVTAVDEAARFLGLGKVVCGGVTYTRTHISLEEVRGLTRPVVQPKKEFLPFDESYLWSTIGVW